MEEHEVPTHVGAEDRVLLWFTFPQIVSLMAVAALSYGIYQAAPIGSEAARVALGLVFAVCGVALVAGRIGGRRLPAVAADLARFSLGARRFSGAPAELARAEPPAPPVRRRASAPLGDSLAAFVQQTARRLRRTRRRARKLANLRHSPRPRTRGERMPFRPRHWFRKRDRRPQRGGRGHRFAPSLLLGGGTALMVAASVVVCSPPMGLAEEGQSEPWTSDEIEFEPPPEIPGRRLYIERLTVTREAATVALRAAVNLELTAQAFGGPDGKTLELTRTHTLGRGAQVSVLVPLRGPAPSVTFSWLDEFGQAGALSLAGAQLPHQLPQVSGELCDLSLTRLTWRLGQLEGSVRSDCRTQLEQPVELLTATGHVQHTGIALLPAEVAAVSGVLRVSAGGREASAPFAANGLTSFELSLSQSRELLAVELEARLTAQLRIARPPLVQLTHHPQRTERRTKQVALERPGTGRTVSRSVAVTDASGRTTMHRISAYLSIPPATVQERVTLEIEHPERITAELVERAPLELERSERFRLETAIAADDAYRALVPPEREPERPPSVQTPLTDAELEALFLELGWGPR